MQAIALKKQSESTPGNSGSIKIQPKLKVNTPGDKYEREADAMAERVMRMKSTGYSASLNQNTSSLLYPSIQRKCNKCEEEEKKKKKSRGTIMRKATGEGGFDAPSGFASQLNTTIAKGRPLPDNTRNFMESAFSTDFSKVRIHTGSKASEMNSAINAKAFTYGNDIYFNRGMYTPDSNVGKKLIAHELTHTIQNTNSIHKTASDFVYVNTNLYPLASSYDYSKLTDDELYYQATEIRDWLKHGILNKDFRKNLNENLTKIMEEGKKRPWLNLYPEVNVNFSKEKPWTFKVEEDVELEAIAWEIYGADLTALIKIGQDEWTGLKHFISIPKYLVSHYKKTFFESMDILLEKDIKWVENKLFETRIDGDDERALINYIGWWSNLKDYHNENGRNYFDVFLGRLRSDKWYRDYGLWTSSSTSYLDTLYEEVEEKAGELISIISQNSYEFGGYRPIWAAVDSKGNLIDSPYKVNNEFVSRAASMLLDALKGYTSSDDIKIIRDIIVGLPPRQKMKVLNKMMSRFDEKEFLVFGKYGEAWKGGMLYWLFEDIEGQAKKDVAKSLIDSGVMSKEIVDGLVQGRGWGGKYLPWTTRKAQESTEFWADCATNREGILSGLCALAGSTSSLWLPETAGATALTLMTAGAMNPKKGFFPQLSIYFPKTAISLGTIGVGTYSFQTTLAIQDLATGKDSWTGQELKAEDKIARILMLSSGALLMGSAYIQARGVITNTGPKVQSSGIRRMSAEETIEFHRTHIKVEVSGMPRGQELYVKADSSAALTAFEASLVPKSGINIGMSNLGGNLNYPYIMTPGAVTTMSIRQIRNLKGPARWQEAEKHIQEQYGSPGQQHFPVKIRPGDFPGVSGTGGRHVDSPVTLKGGGTLSVEVKMYKRWTTVSGIKTMKEVPLSETIRQQIHKDVWLRKQGHDPRWIFIDAPPSKELTSYLQYFRIAHVVYN